MHCTLLPNHLASIDESKGVITDVLTEIEAENINIVALDGFRMSVVHKNIKNAEERKIIINSKIIKHYVLPEKP